PPLACRPSPPQGGRSDVALAFANRKRAGRAPATELPISPLRVGNRIWQRWPPLRPLRDHLSPASGGARKR
ncbi:MAG: hypothetical protein E5X75_33960, partial [Mesorhizobium sp.]